MPDEQKNKPPVLKDDNANSHTDWVFYLQQLLNYAYEQQVLREDGHWGAHTANAVEHYRKHYNLGNDAVVDAETWKKLGYTEAAKAAEVKDIQHDVQLVKAPSEDLCWAAAAATVLSTGTEQTDVDKVCEKAGTGRVRLTFTELAQHASELRLQTVSVKVNDPLSWTGALESEKAIMSLTKEAHLMVVVTGIRKSPANAEKVDLFVMDPVYDRREWVDFHEHFLKDRGLDDVEETDLYTGQ